MGQPSSGAARGAGRDPNVATLLTWFLPGAGHVYLGDLRFALVAFVVVEGLFLLGFFLSGGAVPEFLDPELRGRFALALTPEAANLGGLLWTMQRTGFPDLGTVPREWPRFVMEGSLLTALSGIANVALMVHANTAARAPATGQRRGPSPARLVLLAWAVPGLGHLLQGRRLRALLVFGLLVGLFGAGTLLADLSNLSRERHFYYWAGQFLIGLPAILAEFASGRPPVDHEIPFVDAGLTFACIAGLLNVMAMLDVQRHADLVLHGELPGAPAPRPEAAA